MTGGGLRRVLAATGPVLLDFDGPVCSIFARHPAASIAAELRENLLANGIDLPQPIADEDDPLEILRWTGTLGQDELTRTVEDALCKAELQAVRVATPTPYARETIVAARQSGRHVGVVSNNSAPAITEYLRAHRLTTHVDQVVGRAYAHPDRMKPNPEPILTAVRALDAKPRSCVLIGDSPSDIEASRAAGIHIIGYADKNGKAERLAEAGADAVITSMATLATALLDNEQH